ncbi:MAG: tRNA preQ1(34) S-adenosylmethionine ribosyltransferase-isomerase QueA [Actinomycetia bacterium]|nr:tRNA preQ1(34) S-adenosylmethionine ribosyltransferase-isomerase QueA [Actinomycetes bacterium]MCP4958868.1 tRNA preQ1(34) S-adenosylmethionine ribosyltransferase-isomerase QueA [Actinomycetes bacterium]
MLIAEFDYELAPGAIAQTPIEPRDSARLLIDRGPDAPPEHGRVTDLVDELREGDVLVVNDTRVLAARLRLRKPTGGAAEVLLLEPVGDGTWQALVRPGRRLAPGTVLSSEDGSVEVVVGERIDGGRCLVSIGMGGFAIDDVFSAVALDGVGDTPLPPYITTHLDDPGRYQTVFADRPGSVAAPTAGLHLTDELLDVLRAKGVEVHRVELVVGLDTFRPVMVDDLDDHVMHTEAYHVRAETLEACRVATRVVAVGTTTVRALESAATRASPTGRTDLFIQRGYEWKVVDVLLTNFHMPKSTLLVMIDAFVGKRWRDLYTTALDEGYRFLSFGDAMLLTRQS